MSAIETAQTRLTVVQFGAGAIGRGFLGELWADAGYETVFVDTNRELVQALNDHRAYPLHLVSSDGVQEKQLGPVRAVHVENTQAVLQELQDCAFAATAVGPGLQSVATQIFAPFLRVRGKLRRPSPLPVILCENNPLANQNVWFGLQSLFPTATNTTFTNYKKRLVLMQAVVGRMVPVPKPSASDDPLVVSAEPYYELPVQTTAGEHLPPVAGVKPVRDFDNYIRRKLYIHNGGHAVLAYHGALHGHAYIYECAENPAIVRELEGFWAEATAYLVHCGMNRADLQAHQAELLARFRNVALGDTVARVARDPLRKLSVFDRLTGLALRCRSTKVAEPRFTCRAIAAALRYNDPADKEAQTLQSLIQEQGVRQAFLSASGIAPEDPQNLARLIEQAYETLPGYL
jgi:mannitol-1-phosphate 5-dehydrogenase